MSLLTITYPNFVPFTTILSAQVNQNFADIVTWANGNVCGSAFGPGNILANSITDNELALGTITSGSIGTNTITGGGPGSGNLATLTVTGGLTGNIALDTIGIENLTPALETLITDGAASGRHLDTIVYTAGGLFDKTLYPTANKVKVTCIGGGGGGGGVDGSALDEEAMGSFGGGGGFASRTIDVASLNNTEPILVGAGGGGAAHPNTGGTGGTSSFAAGQAYQVVATGGGGGRSMTSGTATTSFIGGDGASVGSCIGEVTSGGSAGENSTRLANPNIGGGSDDTFVIPQGTSGDGPFGGAVRAPGYNSNGLAGNGPGAGGSGGRTQKAGDGTSNPRSGGNGFAGRVIVEVFS